MKPPLLKLGTGWVITSHCSTYIYLIIHVLIRCWFSWSLLVNGTSEARIAAMFPVLCSILWCVLSIHWPLCSTNSQHSWWRHQMETLSALLALCVGNSPVPGEFPLQRPVTRSFDVFFDMRPNKRLSKQSWGWWFETPLHPLWRHCNVCYLTSVLTFHYERSYYAITLTTLNHL